MTFFPNIPTYATILRSSYEGTPTLPISNNHAQVVFSSIKQLTSISNFNIVIIERLLKKYTHQN